jgi:flavodoxin
MNIIFYFSGTGNSLKVAKMISMELGNTEIIPMGNYKEHILIKKCLCIYFYSVFILINILDK